MTTLIIVATLQQHSELILLLLKNDRYGGAMLHASPSWPPRELWPSGRIQHRIELQFLCLLLESAGARDVIRDTAMYLAGVGDISGEF